MTQAYRLADYLRRVVDPLLTARIPATADHAWLLDCTGQLGQEVLAVRLSRWFTNVQSTHRGQQAHEVAVVLWALRPSLLDCHLYSNESACQQLAAANPLVPPPALLSKRPR
jgi:hypothetical protein